jgi:hypothetical protein
MSRKSLKTDKQKDRRIKCIYCDKPIHIDNFAGVCKKGFICGNSVCLMKLAQEQQVPYKMTQQILNQEKPTEQFMRFISVYKNDTEMLEAISQIFLNGKSFDLDPTFSKGNFYKKFPEPKFKSDLVPQREDVIECDCRNLNYIQSGTIKSICFDPPFLFRNRKAVNNDKMCARFSYFQTFEELLLMYYESLKEFYRVLETRGILVFKCQDLTDGSGSRPFFDTHTEIIKMARAIGFSLRDIGILVVKNKIIRKAKQQSCLRKVHSYYLVFRKETAPVVTLNPTDSIFLSEKAINISLKDNSNELSQISSNDETSLNNNIRRNF